MAGLSRRVTLQLLSAVLAALLLAEARPAPEYAEYLGLAADMATVGSLRREVRQPGPAAQAAQATEVSDLLSSSNAPKQHMKNASGKSNEGGFFKTYGSDAEGEKGYLKKSFSKGDHGYKSLDTFHKKLGDRYGFEEHEAFGKASADDEHQQHGAKSAKSAKSSSKRKQDGDHEGAGTDLESHYASDDGGGEHSEYGGGEHYSDGDSSSYSDGGTEGSSESYSSGGDGDGYSAHEAYSSGGESSAEDDGGSYY